MKAQNAAARLAVPPALQHFIDGGQAVALQFGFLVENARLKVRRSLAASASGRNPEDSKPSRKHTRDRQAVAECPAMTPEDRLCRDSSGHPFVRGSFRLDHKGALGCVHVDSQGPESEAVVSAIVIISECGGAFVCV